jgi:hypothetical protein
VLYIEDTGQWCYDTAAGTFVEDGSANAAVLQRELAKLDEKLARSWFFRDAGGHTFGKPWGEVVDFCRGADLFLHVSASCWMRDEYLAAQRLAFIDSDPIYTQASIPDYVAGTIQEPARSRVEMLRRHDVHFTFGENIGAPDCRIPTDLFNWLPTRQPIVMDCFAPHRVPLSARRPVLTTVASWEPSTTQGPTVNGVAYCGKSVEFERFMDLPSRSRMPLELAMGGLAPVERLRQHGWVMRDSSAVSGDPWRYRTYLAESAGEWSVAKNAYVASRSGWFSCRTACYLALGVPAVVQDTGFTQYVPVGEGVLAFNTLDEAAEGIEALRTNPERHAKAAEEVAREYFGADKVLGQLLERALNSPEKKD